MQSIDNKIISRIYGFGRGWAFSQNDFSEIGSAAAIRKALSRFEQAGTIRRVMRGVYDYPKFSTHLNQSLSPDVDQVALALARKFNWRISPTGDTALNLLGLSTQVPGRYVYLCDGASRDYALGRLTIAFKKTSLKEMGFKLRESELLVQAIKALGKARISDAVIADFKKALNPAVGKQVLKDTKMTTAWGYAVIKRVYTDSVV